MIGTDTRNSESGSGGEKAAPSTKVMNHMCLRYEIRSFRSIAPELSDSNVIKGAWKPIALARHRLMINPTKDDSVHSVDNPAY